MTLFLYRFGPAIAALLIALVASFIRRKSHLQLPKPVRRWTFIGMVVALGCMITFTAWSVWPWWIPPLGEDEVLFLLLARYLVPLILSIAALIWLIVPAPDPGPSGTAALAPRTLMTFTSRARLGTMLCVLAGVVAITFLAGLASDPDENGRHVIYEVQTSSTNTASTTIYGWWFSTPCLILIAVLVLTALIGTIVISRPALGVDAGIDSAIRAARVRNILMVSTGGLLLHLSAVLQSLSATSSLRTGMAAGPAGLIEFGTSFAAIGPALQVASLISYILGLALWLSTLLSVLPIGMRQTSQPVSA